MIATLLIALVILLHIYFVVLEMFLWDKPYGRKAFGMTEEFARESKSLAMNQGLYNGFLVAGLLWGLSLAPAGKSILIFFLSCIVVAGIFGGLTVSKKIFFVQAIPALAALLFLLLNL